MKGRIIVLTNSIGGLHSFRKEVMKAIVDAGYEVYISEPDDDERVSYFQDIGCNIIKTKFDRRGVNPVADYGLMQTYRRIIKQLNPLAVLSYTIKPNIYGGIACRLSRTPQIANVTGLGDAVENGGWLQKLTVALYRIGLGRTNTIFFQNRANRDFCIKNKIARADSVLLPGSGVNLSYHSLQPYPLDDSSVKFLFIGRMLRDKGIEEYFSAAQLIKSQYPNTEFQVLGSCEGDYESELNRLVESGVINYLGSTSDVRPYLTRVHCTVMPSYHEGMSNVNLESSASGRPVITTDVPGCRETVSDGISGFLVREKDGKDLAAKMERFINIPYDKKVEMGLAARKKVEQEFDRQIVINAYLDAINRL